MLLIRGAFFWGAGWYSGIPARGNLFLCLFFFSLSKRESETESKKEADRKRRVFVSLTFILSGEWI
jgi:hypothetical protein